MKNKKTYSAKPKEVKRLWYLMDAGDKILGRVAVKAASVLWGKNKPMFTDSAKEQRQRRQRSARTRRASGGYRA